MMVLVCNGSKLKFYNIGSRGAATGTNDGNGSKLQLYANETPTQGIEEA
jgi:hypothetical protein